MIFNRKIKCYNCSAKVNQKFSFCPHCGENLVDEEKHVRDYGLLGKGEELTSDQQDSFGLGMTEKFLGSLMNTLIKSLDKQFRTADKDFKRAEIKSYPNGIKIRMGPVSSQSPKQKSIFQRSISKEQLERMNSLPRSAAETKIKRLN